MKATIEMVSSDGTVTTKVVVGPYIAAQLFPDEGPTKRCKITIYSDSFRGQVMRTLLLAGVFLVDTDHRHQEEATTQ